MGRCLPILIFLIPYLSGCDTELIPLPLGMTTVMIPDGPEDSKPAKGIPVDIYVPSGKKPAGDVMVLPGWKFSRKRWHAETDILKQADTMGFRLIFPEMNISNYESRYFPETHIRWAAMPGGQWIREILIPTLQKKYGIFLKGKRNFIMGLSTGGRGVLLVSLQNPGIFIAGATLSGDCDQTMYPSDRLMIGTYGPYEGFKKRWETVDNPLGEAADGKWRMPLYIGHGRDDKTSPFIQSQVLYETLRKRYPGLRVIFHAVDGAGHDFAYWGSEVKPALTFFLETR